MSSIPLRPKKQKLDDNPQAPDLKRESFITSRLMDFLTEKELTAQIGHGRSAWALVLVKELIDNALDACEESGVAPDITVIVDEHGLTVRDNGPGIPPEVVNGVLNFAVRVSSREAYVSPCRGAQGNALKTIVAIPFVLDGESGRVTISARGIRHEITLRVNRIQQQPVIKHIKHEDHDVQFGTSITVHSSTSPSDGKSLFIQNEEEATDEEDEEYEDDEEGIAQNYDDEDRESSSSPICGKSRIVQFADDFTFVNPHVSMRLDWFGERLLDVTSTNPSWTKWKPCDPTSPHWYELEHFTRLVSANISHNEGKCGRRTVRELISEFRGLAKSAKQKTVLDATGLHRALLTSLVNADGTSLDDVLLSKLLETMKAESKPVKPAILGTIGREHLTAKFAALGCQMDSFNYQKAVGETCGLPWVIEAAFGWCPNATRRRIVTGVNWSPGILNPFRELGNGGQSLDTILANQRATANEPVIVLLHLACPRVVFADRGKSTIIIEG